MAQSRRDFLKDSAVGGAGLGLLSLSATAAAQVRRYMRAARDMSDCAARGRTTNIAKMKVDQLRCNRCHQHLSQPRALVHRTSD